MKDKHRNFEFCKVSDIQMTDDWLREMYDKKIVGAVLLDFSVAFDTIDHSLLLEKRMCYGFTPPALLGIKSYMSERTQRVFFNGILSNIIQVESGIPQGSCLGLLLISICVCMRMTHHYTR